MPAKQKVTKEDIINAAFELVRSDSAGALSARAVAAKLGCSTQPVFSNFPGMRELYEAVIAKAWGLYAERTSADMRSGRYPPYKASGMAYIAFAVDEPELFKLLFMRDRIADGDADRNTVVDGVIAAIMSALGISRALAERFHNEMWIFVHGLAVMYATRFSVYDEGAVSDMLSDIYNGLVSVYRERSCADD